MMKKTILSAVVVVLVLSFMSCGANKNEMDKKETLDLVVETVKKNIDFDKYKVTGVSWSELDQLSNELRFITINYTDQENTRMTVAIDMKEGKPVVSTPEASSVKAKGKYVYDKTEFLTLEDLNTDLLLAQTNDALSKVPEGYEYRSLYKWHVTTDYKKVILRVVEKGNATSVRGRNIITTYYEVEYKGNPDGTVELID